MENQVTSQEMEHGTGEQQAPEINKFLLERHLQELRDNQNLVLGTVGGVAGAFVGATLWAIITALTNYQIGWMAVGVGFLVGYSVRTFGKGIDTIYGVAGAVISLLGCLAGNFLTVIILISRQESVPVLDILSRITPQITLALMKETFHPLDVLFYGIAIYEGYRLSFKPFSDEDLARVSR